MVSTLVLAHEARFRIRPGTAPERGDLPVGHYALRYHKTDIMCPGPHRPHPSRCIITWCEVACRSKRLLLGTAVSILPLVCEHGEIVEMPPACDNPGYASGEIFATLRDYVRRTKQGQAYGDGVGFHVYLPHREAFNPDAAACIPRCSTCLRASGLGEYPERRRDARHP